MGGFSVNAIPVLTAPDPRCSVTVRDSSYTVQVAQVAVGTVSVVPRSGSMLCQGSPKATFNFTVDSDTGGSLALTAVGRACSVASSGEQTGDSAALSVSGSTAPSFSGQLLNNSYVRW